MKLRFFLFLLICSNAVCAMENGDQKKLKIATDKYITGFYTECIQLVNPYTQKKYFNKNALLASDAFFLKSLSYYRLCETNNYSSILNEWQENVNGMQNDSIKDICLFKLAQFFLETGDLKRADSLLRLPSNSLPLKLKNDIVLLSAELLLQQGEINSARKNNLSQYQERKNNAEQDQGNSNFVLLNNDRRIYQDLIFRQIRISILHGEPDTAKTWILNHRSWASMNMKSQQTERELERLTGELEMMRRNASQAYTHFKKAYEIQGFADGEYIKLDVLNKLIILSYKIEYNDIGQNLLRRLQMLASIAVGKSEPFDLAYQKTQVMLDLQDNQFGEAKSKIDRLHKNLETLPEFHPNRMDFKKFSSILLLYQKELNVPLTLDSLIIEYKVKLSTSHPFVRDLLIQKIYFQINYGTALSGISEDISNFKSLFIEKGYRGISLLDYYELNTKLQQLNDDYTTARISARLGKELAEKIFGISDEKNIYYNSIYSKALLLEGDYKNFTSSFSDLKKIFAEKEWISKDEKLKVHSVISSINRIIGEKDEFNTSMLRMLSETELSKKGDVYSTAAGESQMAFIQFQNGNIFKAEKLIKKSYEQKKSLLLLNSVTFIEDLFFIASLELDKGNFNETEKHLIEAAEIIKMAYGEKSILYTDYLQHHADYCIAIGDYKRADEYIQKAQTILNGKKSYSSLYQVPLNSKKAYILAHSVKKDSDKENIITLYNESLQILESTIGKENLVYMDVLEKKAHFLTQIKNLNLADSILVVVETYWKKRSGNENAELLEVYLLRGDIYYEKGDYEKAKSFYTNVRSIAGNLYDSRNHYYTSASARIAKVAYMQNRTDEALSEMEALLPKYMNVVSKNFPALSFREKAKYWNMMKDEFEFYVFLVMSKKELSDKYSKEVYNNVIATKAILLSNNIKFKQSILSSGDTLLVKAYNDWIDLKEYYTSVSSLTKTELEEQKIDLKTIEAEIERKEKQLSNRSELFKTEDKMSNATFKDIYQILSADEYAIEIVRYRTFDKYFTENINYAALIVNKKYEAPQVVVFPEGVHFETKGIKYARNVARYHKKDLNSYSYFWQPLEAIVPEGATVYLSSEGVYNQFNLEMIPDQQGKFMLDKYEIVQVTNTKELLRLVYAEKTKNKEIAKQIVFGGNPAFYKGDFEDYEFKVNDLPGAAKEVENLSVLFAGNKTEVVKVMGTELKEEWVKNLNNPRVFHIATHGYYSESNNAEEENNAMLNSGLLLYSAGDILGTESHVNSQDGILTAYEAMNLKLDNTELVVLSACETGLGEVQAGEGVYGLQRSFLIAGSKTIIISLYKVNDEVTQKLMVEFYSNWIKTGDIRKSFITAKQKIKMEYPDVPVYWGAFVLIEGKPDVKKSNYGKL